MASGANRVYWSNEGGTAISFANLDGSGAGDIFNGATESAGLAVDSATGRIYYTNEGANTIGFLNPDGSAGGTLNTGTATVQAPDGLAIDPASRKIFWANDDIPGSIGFASLDGSGGADLDTTGATLDGPSGVTVDTATGRLYWSNYNGATISFANLNDSGGGGDLSTSGATVVIPAGVAIDPASRRIFWSDLSGTIGFARLDGSGGGDLPTTGAPVDVPYGVAIDPEAGIVYWANDGGDDIGLAKLDGSGGGRIPTAGATNEGSAFPIVQKVPTGTGPPAISGGSSVGTTLSCSQGSWSSDIFEALLYRAPSAFAYQWSREGSDVAGATASSIKATSAGTYVCRVTGSNQAGSASQTSAPHRVGPPVPPDFDTALLEGGFLYLRLKCAPRFKPECIGSASAVTAKDRCTTRKGKRHCKQGKPMSASVSAKQKPNKWHVAKLKVKPKFTAAVNKMAKKPQKKLLIVRQSVHAKKFKHGRKQSVFHIYRVRTANP
ncbi:MAG TPA: YncE family protein [Solirubrobacterales bacterium]